MNESICMYVNRRLLRQQKTGTAQLCRYYNIVAFMSDGRSMPPSVDVDCTSHVEVTHVYSGHGCVRSPDCTCGKHSEPPLCLTFYPQIVLSLLIVCNWQWKLV